MIEDSKYCSDIIKIHFNKKLVMTKEDNEDCNNSFRCWFCDHAYVDNDVKVRDHCHITRKYRGSAHRDYIINLKLNHEIPTFFHNLKKHDCYLIMQELGKFNLRINVIPNRLEKYMSFTIKNQLTHVIPHLILLIKLQLDCLLG